MKPVNSETPLNDTYWFLNSLVTFKSKSATAGSFSLVEQLAPMGFATPFHTHAGEDEAWYVLEGEITLFREGEKTVLRAGDYASAVGTTPHGFQVSGSSPAKLLLILTPGLQFPSFVQEVGEPAAESRLPVPSQPNFLQLKEISERHGSTILGSLPL